MKSDFVRRIVDMNLRWMNRCDLTQPYDVGVRIECFEPLLSPLNARSLSERQNSMAYLSGHEPNKLPLKHYGAGSGFA